MLRSSFAALLLAPSLAAGQGLAAKGSLVITANRLIPIVAYTSNGTGSDPNKSTSKVTTISLLGNPFGAVQSFYNVPRLGFDYTVANNVTIGGDATVFVTAAASHQSGSLASQDSDKLTVLGISPRLGYVAVLSPTVYFWPRAGITYLALTDSPPSGSTSSTINQFGFNAEALFVFAPAEHVAITLGPVVDAPITGSSSSGSSQSIDSAELHIGLTAGLGVWF